jgi:hypothetical protein
LFIGNIRIFKGGSRIKNYTFFLTLAQICSVAFVQSVSVPLKANLTTAQIRQQHFSLTAYLRQNEPE